jgi:hypothetical protein
MNYLVCMHMWHGRWSMVRDPSTGRPLPRVVCPHDVPVLPTAQEEVNLARCGSDMYIFPIPAARLFKTMSTAL